MKKYVAIISVTLWIFCVSQLSYSQAFYVATTGNDINPGTEASPWKTIQKAFNSATAGSTVFLKAGVYNEKLTLNVSGSLTEGFITFQNYGNDTVIIDGTGITGDQMILIQNKNYIKIIGFELRNNLNQTFGTGIWVQGFADHIELRNNRIHDMRAASGGGDAMGISIYGNHATTSISNIVVDGNQIYNCEPGHSESLTLNGNIDTFYVTNNLIHDVDNIGIDMIGGEGTCPTPALDAARNGICSGNTVYNARSNYGGGYAAGIYVDGGRNIIVERNKIYQCDIGLEIGCENRGKIASDIIVRNNLIFNNDKGGIGFGGYDYPRTGQVTNSQFFNNTCFHNDVLNTGQGELNIQYALNCTVKNNIFHSTSQNRLMTTTVGNSSGNVLNYNLWFTTGGTNNASVDYNGTIYNTFVDYKTGTGQDANSLFSNPQFVSTTLPNTNLHLQLVSPAIDAGDPAFVPSLAELDFDGNPRVLNGRIDIGAIEHASSKPSIPAPQLVGVACNSTLSTFVWNSSIGASIYHLQISRDLNFATIAFEDSTITDTSRSVSSLSDSTLFFWRVLAKNNFGSSDWSRTWSFFTTNGNFMCTVSDRWNLISTPVIAVDYRKEIMFPSSSSPAYSYEGMYKQKDTLTHGIGYWLKFNGAQNVSMDGSLIAEDTIDVVRGWNLIGSISSLIATSAVTSIPSGIVTSSFFQYNNGYVAADSIRPGKGYWVKVNQNAQLILSSTLTILRADRITIMPTSELPPLPPTEDLTLPHDLPKEFGLAQNYPNPFNPSTTIEYDMPSAGRVSLSIYNVLGQEVEKKLIEHDSPGRYSYRWQAENFPSGIYLYHLVVLTPNKMIIESRKMLLLR